MKKRCTQVCLWLTFALFIPKSLLLGQSSLPTQIGTIPLPQGYERVKSEPQSFGAFLRSIPLVVQKNAPIYNYDGSLNGYQSGHYAVLDKPIGKKDIEQCADMVMRLYAEYHYESRRFDKIKFRLATGQMADFESYAAGKRPVLAGNKWQFEPKAKPNQDKSTFQQYLNFVYTYANTASLLPQLKKVALQDLRVGDIFIQTGAPFGHAVLVADMIENQVTKERKILLIQGFMPAQSFHVLKNLSDGSAWYQVGQELILPQWHFKAADLYRF
ncbi:DUF4846 domain-containing protein [Hugenholtzia roseola]|uniref:DUF4846 domain-containing protein n=1 Tax=Hugenholtzia roseola TaxID=1002 RepID=UPI0006842EC2|nr:DUF4846 domain-containing protein [Hugenholtzia roseola]